MSIDLDTLALGLLIWNAIGALITLLVFLFALVRGKVSIAWMRRHFVDRK